MRTQDFYPSLRRKRSNSNHSDAASNLATEKSNAGSVEKTPGSTPLAKLCIRLGHPAKQVKERSGHSILSRATDNFVRGYCKDHALKWAKDFPAFWKDDIALE